MAMAKIIIGFQTVKKFRDLYKLLGFDQKWLGLGGVPVPIVQG